MDIYIIYGNMWYNIVYNTICKHIIENLVYMDIILRIITVIYNKYNCMMVYWWENMGFPARHGDIPSPPDSPEKSWKFRKQNR